MSVARLELGEFKLEGRGFTVEALRQIMGVEGLTNHVRWFCRAGIKLYDGYIR